MGDLVAQIAKALADRDARRAARGTLKAEKRRRSQEIRDISAQREQDLNPRTMEMTMQQTELLKS